MVAHVIGKRRVECRHVGETVSRVEPRRLDQSIQIDQHANRGARALFIEGGRLDGQRPAVARIDGEAVVAGRQRGRRVTPAKQQFGQIVMSRGGIGVELDGAQERRLGLVIAAQIRQRGAESAMRFGEAGIERLRHAPEHGQCAAQIVVIARDGRAHADRVTDQRDGGRPVAASMRDEAAQVKRVRAVGTPRQYLAVVGVCLVEPSGPMRLERRAKHAAEARRGFTVVTPALGHRTHRPTAPRPP